MTCQHFTLVRRAVDMEHPVITQSLHDVALAGFSFDGPFCNEMIELNWMFTYFNSTTIH